MADDTWPAGLPQAPDSYANYNRTLRESRIESPVDSGPPRLRSVFTQALFDVTCTMYITRRQIATFENFYNSTLSRGTKRFNWKDFEQDPDAASSNVEYQFAGAEPYGYQIMGPDNYLLSLKMVMFPA